MSIPSGEFFNGLLAPTECDDIVQEAFATAFDKLRQLETPESFGGWLRSIVIRVARRAIRKNRIFSALRLRDETVIEDLECEGVTAEQSAELRLLYARLDRFPTEVRLALVLRLAEDRTVPEIASELGVSEPTVKRRLNQGMERLERYRKGGTRR